MGLHPQMNRDMSFWGREYASWTAPCSVSLPKIADVQLVRLFLSAPNAESSWQIWKGSPVTV